MQDMTAPATAQSRGHEIVEQVVRLVDKKQFEEATAYIAPLARTDRLAALEALRQTQELALAAALLITVTPHRE